MTRLGKEFMKLASKDEWFDKFHARSLTRKFVHWWVDEYGLPSGYEDSENEQREYWIRCGFALKGFLTGKASFNPFGYLQELSKFMPFMDPEWYSRIVEKMPEHKGHWMSPLPVWRPVYDFHCWTCDCDLEYRWR